MGLKVISRFLVIDKYMLKMLLDLNLLQNILNIVLFLTITVVVYTFKDIALQS